MRALIIDDEIQIRRLLRLALEARGYEVREAEAGQLGLQEAAFHRPDVILLDLGLPDMDGAQVLQRLREWSEVTQKQLLKAVWGPGADTHAHSLRVYVNLLRKKLQVDPGAPRIQNEPGIGYRMSAPEQGAA